MCPATFEYHAPTSIEEALSLLERYGGEAKVAELARTIGWRVSTGLVPEAEAVVVATMGRGDEDALARVRSPAGLDLGPASQEEIAVAVLAELVAWRHTRPQPDTVPAAAEATDPVCGMAVAVDGAKETAEYGGVTYYFCNPGCRQRFEADPARYVEALAR